jgi:hypothetical protein
MVAPLIAPLLSIGSKLIDRLIPDKEQQAAAKLKLIELEQAGDLKALESDMQIALAQIDVNKAEASSPSLFKGGWRPAIGWVGALGLFYQFIAQPLLAWYSSFLMLPAAPPVLDLGDLLTILGGMLGLSGMRSWERVRGVIPRGR